MLKKSKIRRRRLVKRSRVPKSVRNAAISTAVLFVLFVTGGVVYTYVNGRHGLQKAIAVADVPDPNVAIKPVLPANNAKEGVAVQTISSPVTPGTNASITVDTNARSICVISVQYNNVTSTDSGLRPKAANDYGTVSWSWTIDSSVVPGTYPIKVTCTFNKQDAVVQADLLVTKS